MNKFSLDDWRYSPAEAIAEQRRLAARVQLCDSSTRIETVAGVDVGFEEQGRITRAAVVVMSFPELHIIERQLARCETTMPYIPGLLSFRELPALLMAFEKIVTSVDMVLCDGQGYAHPRRLGIACHLGLLMDTPTIGVGKSRLVGEYQEPGPAKGDWSPLKDKGEQVGYVLRSRQGVKLLYISPGHLVSFERALEVTLRCLGRYRLPEPIRAAHHLASVEK